MANVFLRLKAFSNRKSVKYGAPFLILLLGGSFGLSHFTRLRYEYSKNQTITPEIAEQYGIKMKKPGEVTLETEYEKIQNLDIENWTQKRGPRPWEESQS